MSYPGRMNGGGGSFAACMIVHFHQTSEILSISEKPIYSILSKGSRDLIIRHWGGDGLMSLDKTSGVERVCGLLWLRSVTYAAVIWRNSYSLS